jgi:DNA-binding GntR family transcriptional regulator
VLYAQLAARLRGLVIAGSFPLGSMIPSEPAIVREYEVSRYTAERALRLLVDEGIIERRPGIGSIVVRVPELATIEAGPGTRVFSRMATSEERRELGLAPGDQVLVISRAGKSDQVYLADRTVIVVSGAGT